MTDKESITGRDEYIICQALALAFCASEMLPPERRAASNQEDMLALLKHHQPESYDTYIEDAASTLIGSSFAETSIASEK